MPFCLQSKPPIRHLVPGNGRRDVRPAQAVQREGLDVRWRDRQHAAIAAVHVTGQRLAHPSLQAYAASLATYVDTRARRWFKDVWRIIPVSVERFVTSAAKSFRRQAMCNVFRIDMGEPISNPKYCDC